MKGLPELSAGLYNVDGTYTQKGKLLAVPRKRIAGKSQFLLDLEAKQEWENRKLDSFPNDNWGDKVSPMVRK